jgi:acyl-CoA synthetase (AMP-forming)/AMP-acid ligase II
MLMRMLLESAARNPEKTALIQGKRRIRYGDLCGWVERCAAGLRDRGVGEGVAAILPNCPEFIAMPLPRWVRSFFRSIPAIKKTNSSGS